MGEDLAARGADRDARLPGGALADRRRGAAAGRQQPPDEHSNRRLPHKGRAHQHFGRLCGALGAPELKSDPRYVNEKARSANRDALNAALEDYTAQRNSDEWVDILNRAGVPCGPINRIDQVFADPQVNHLGIVQPVEHPSLGRLDLIGQAMSLSRTPSSLRTATPERGEHNDEVLRELGYDEAAIAALRAKYVV
jgi:crotonobetainyl-CoA:carnitine CoA-transferase CaiB-like acyl-CoA transferase